MLHRSVPRIIYIGLVIIFIGLLVFFHFQRSQQKIEGNIVQLRADLIEAHLQNYLKPILRSSELLSINGFLENWLSSDGSRESLNRFLEEAQDSIGCECIDLASSSDELVYQSAGTTVRMDPKNSRDQWYYDFMALEDEKNIEFFYDSLKGTLYIYYNIKIVADSGEVLGVLGISIRYDDIAELLSSYQKDGMEAYIIDASGNILIHPDQRKIGNVPIYDYYGLLQRSESPQLTRGWQLPLSEGISRYVHYIESIDCYLIVEQDMKILFLHAYQPHLFMLGVCLILILGELLFCFLSRYVQRGRKG